MPRRARPVARHFLHRPLIGTWVVRGSPDLGCDAELGLILTVPHSAWMGALFSAEKWGKTKAERRRKTRTTRRGRRRRSAKWKQKRIEIYRFSPAGRPRRAAPRPRGCGRRRERGALHATVVRIAVSVSLFRSFQYCTTGVSYTPRKGYDQGL